MADTSTKTIVITGASDGIGLAAARALTRLGHKTVLVGRSPDKTAFAAAGLGADYFCCDFAKLADVRLLAATLMERYPAIDVLCNNAGGIMGARQVTVDGHEQTFQVNHLAPFLLTTLLLPRLIESGSSVIATSSSANKLSKLLIDDLDAERKYVAFRAYANAKLANIMFTKELDRRFRISGVTTASMEPGPVATNFAAGAGGTTQLLYHSVLNRFLLSPDKGADTLVWLANSTPGEDFLSGNHYCKRRVTKAHRDSESEDLSHRLWERTADMVSQTCR
jgi:NAD(P)-dependent dehydrogenase (short-subunit alcohol dehydrogenase family)